MGVAKKKKKTVVSDSIAYNENHLLATSETLEGMGTSFECSDFWDHLGGQPSVIISNVCPPNHLRNRFAESLYCNQVIGATGSEVEE